MLELCLKPLGTLIIPSLTDCPLQGFHQGMVEVRDAAGVSAESSAETALPFLWSDCQSSERRTYANVNTMVPRFNCCQVMLAVRTAKHNFLLFS